MIYLYLWYFSRFNIRYSKTFTQILFMSDFLFFFFFF